MTQTLNQATDFENAKGHEMQNVRAVVTGGTRGIGAAIAAKLAQRGARVVISARGPAETLPEGVELVRADAATAAGAEHLAAEALNALGEVDVLVNNAGGATPSPGGIASIPDDDWVAALEANLLSAVRLDKLLVPGMRKRKRGVVVHISSSSARQPVGPIAHYAASKAALTAYAKALALETAADGVRVDAVSPGMTMTSAVEGALAMLAKAQGTDVNMRKEL